MANCIVIKSGTDWAKRFRLNAGSVARQWSGAEPLLRAASGCVPNSRVSGFAGQPRKGIEGVAAKEGIAKTEVRDDVAPKSVGSESLGEVAVVPLRTPGFSHGEAQLEFAIIAVDLTNFCTLKTAKRRGG
ncbi:MAG: hypothetical protein ACUVTP_09235 [Candidatus Fervidibacter sp.]|uniref:hypothetical protein n=1 Tax=Candidatus Fervidibacter sp. TaxID=3100871 RepID=UPI004049B614